MINTNIGNTISKDFKKINLNSNKAFYSGIEKSYLVGKRIFDIFFSLIIITCLLSWLLPICFILIKLDSKGPVFFIQKRVGRKGRLFICLKLRTMIVNNLSDVKQATPDDRRITKIGRFLRNTNIDEFPQFFNVLMGDMSIVGPRPHMEKDCEDFKEVVTSYDLRHSVKPGVTGLAQIKGFRGPTMDEKSIVLRYQWDVFYVHNLSFSLDFKIIKHTFLQTASLVFRVTNADSEKEIRKETAFTPATEIVQVKEQSKKMVV